ncbi:MAG: ribonuclease PH [Candidatus Latescibacterota bacterium]|nr:ribonuclease PH [Candidatus Latescibacterota bacterium]
MSDHIQASRADGRGEDELRPVRITPGFTRNTPGSVLVEMGETRVLCTLSVEERVPAFLVGTAKGWLTAEYSMLPGSSPQRVSRELSGGRPNSRSREIQRLIGRSLRAVVDLQAVGERTLYVDCDVLQADGGTRTASITGGYVALVTGIRSLQSEGRLEGDPVIGQIAAVSAGIVAERPLLDLCYQEDSRAETDMNVVMTADEGIVEVQATAEGVPLTRGQAERLLDLAWKGISELLHHQQDTLSGHTPTS